SRFANLHRCPREGAVMRSLFAFLLGLLGFAPFVAAQPPTASPNTTNAATVNGEQIALADVDAVLKNTLPLTPLTAAQKRQMRIEVLADMVDDLLLRQFLR